MYPLPSFGFPWIFSIVGQVVGQEANEGRRRTLVSPADLKIPPLTQDDAGGLTKARRGRGTNHPGPCSSYAACE